MRTTILPRSLPFALLGAAFFTSPHAEACGGLFCSSSNPVNQVAERIIFAQNEDDTITAAIEIQYAGPARDFAWVLPVPAGDVSVGVSSKQALDALQAASNPVYQLNTTFEECGSTLNSATSAPRAGQGSADDASGGSDVTVLSSGAVGPYDWVVIEVDPSLEDRADAAVEWLTENGFDVSALGPDVLRIYLDQDMNLLAFKLSKDSDSGSIRPVLVTYPGERPVIPIQPTAVAAQDDMGIMVWVLGAGRAVPTNYLSLELNEARINWLNPSPTYNDVVVAAADEAGGWGFVTEQAGRARPFAQSILSDYKVAEFEQLRTGQFGSLDQFIQQAIYAAQAPFVFTGGFGDVSYDREFYDGFMDVMSDPELVPLREGATAEQLLACVHCYFDPAPAVNNDAYPPTPYVAGEDPIDAMDITLFLDEFEEQVVAPLRQTRKLFLDHDTVTRFYTTLSPDEMTIDPVFDTNPDLPDVDNVHVADRVMHCDGQSFTVTLPQGHSIYSEDGNWPVPEQTNVLPYNLRALQLSARGNGEVVFDNHDDVSAGLVDLGVSPEPKESDGFCTVTPARRDGWLSPLAGLFLATLLLRRRPR
jgi:hypothetical protein